MIGDTIIERFDGTSDMEDGMNDNDIRQQDIDSAAAALTGATNLTSQQWRQCADQTHGRTSAVYGRCAELEQAQQELQGL